MKSVYLTNTMQTLCATFGLILVAVSLTGCSVGMALNGKKEPDLNVIKQHATRTDVEFQLGVPTKLIEQPDGKKQATYEYEIGKEASTGRAVAHGAMDVVTLGLWEVIGTPVEACKGDKMQMDIVYDQHDRLITAHKKIIK